MPETKEEWSYYARKIAERWQFPNCIGAADGKHISVLHPFGSGSAYYNYKGYFIIVLQAVLAFNYEFLFVDVGCLGSISDGGVYRNNPFYDAIQKGSLNLPDPEPLPQSIDPACMYGQSIEPMPFVFVVVSDDAFPLGTNCMKPFPQSNLDEFSITGYQGCGESAKMCLGYG